jgi:hypothetical protein
METSENNGQRRRDQSLVVPAQAQVQQSARHRPTQAGSAAADQRQNLAEAARAQRAQRRVRALLISADYRLRDRVRHPDGGRRTALEVQQDEAMQRAQIEEENKRGSQKHRRLSGWLHRMPKLILLFDFCLLLYFFAGITDVNWSSPLSAVLAFAVLLAAVVTVAPYGFLSFTGHRLRSHKDHSGVVRFDELDGISRASSLVAVAVIAVLAMLMFTRMKIEIIYALGAGFGGTATMIALTLAVVYAVANFLVVAVHALDGSDEVERLERLSAAAHRSLAKVHRMREQAAHQANR